MIEKSESVFVLEDAKAVVISHNLAEGAAFVEFAGLGAHLRWEPSSCSEKRIMPAQKTTGSSIWECRDSSTRGLCAPVLSHSPRRLCSWNRWRHPADRRPSYRA